VAMMDAMEQPSSTMAQRIAQAAIAFERRRTGRPPSKATVVLTNDTLVITLHGILSRAEKALAKNSTGAAEVEEFHHQLFANSSEALLEEIKSITGHGVSEATAEIEKCSGPVVKVFSTGTEVQVFRLAGNVPTDTWSGNGDGRESDDRS
jgi:uncharacterized protein YbcI